MDAIMNLNEDRTFEAIVIACIYILFVAMGYAILSPIKPKEVEPIVIEQGREIPECDKELWVRIKDGCDDKDSD